VALSLFQPDVTDCPSRGRSIVCQSMLLGVFVAAQLIFASQPCAAQNQHASSDAPAKIMKVTEIEGISEYRLNNGVRVLLFPDSSKETVV
jgi:zinc protease